MLLGLLHGGNAGDFNGVLDRRLVDTLRILAATEHDLSSIKQEVSYRATAGLTAATTGHFVMSYGVLVPGAILRDWTVPRVAEDGQQEGLGAGCANPV